MDWIITGASRGIGRALVLELARAAAPGDRIFALARDVDRLDALARELAASACELVVVPVDLARRDAAAEAGRALAGRVRPGAVLVHNAGLWPSRRELVDGLERAFVVNCVAPLALQAPLVAAGALARVLVVSAGLLVKGRFDAARTPTGGDFSGIRTYCTTKLAGAIALRDAARDHPEVDVAIVHPGVVATDLGARGGPLGWLLRLVKRRWEAPAVCAARLARILARPRWQARPGVAPWLVEEAEQPWPAAVARDEQAVLAALADLGVTRTRG